MRMLAQILSDRGEQFSVLSLLDERSSPCNAPGYLSVGCGGSKFSFCLEAFRLARSGLLRTTIVGHVGLLPLVWGLYKIRLIKRYAVVLHGIEAWRRLSWISRIAARNATAIVSTTQYTAREFCYFNGLRSREGKVIPLACSFREHPLVRPAPSAALKILTVSRLSVSDAYKGIDTLLQAVCRGRERGLSLTLDIVGSGNDENRLQNLTRAMGLAEVVRFRGAVDDNTLERLFSECHVFSMPSKKEGFGIVFLEAMMAGLPCIGANHGGTPEVIEHGTSGFLIEYGDVNQLVFYLRALAESPDLYVTMSDAARCRAAEKFSFSAMAESWRQLVNTLSDVNISLKKQQSRNTIDEEPSFPHATP
jgi:phosphatidyl-myo-inositol dimannoside synthase